MVLDRKRSELYTRVAHGTPPLRLPVTAGLVGYAVSKGEPVFINDVYTNEEFKDVLQSGAIATDRITGYRTKSLMVIPFCNSEGEIIGAYQAVNKLTREAQFSQRDVEHLCLAASYAGKALESALLTNEIEETQKEILLTMGAIGESRSRETGNHVKRVAEDSYLLGLVPA
ncbi:GAF domain-containing protein [Paenibacillus sp. P26]|nr:GAF domain-containing protein [Paenibacillus sp. P26]